MFLVPVSGVGHGGVDQDSMPKHLLVSLEEQWPPILQCDKGHQNLNALYRIIP